jgi:hypothetical protein
MCRVRSLVCAHVINDTDGYLRRGRMVAGQGGEQAYDVETAQNEQLWQELFQVRFTIPFWQWT